MRFLLAIGLILLFLCEFMFLEKCYYVDILSLLAFSLLRQLMAHSFLFVLLSAYLSIAHFSGLHMAQTANDTLYGNPCVVG